MSEAVKPVTSFLIEDILSSKGSTGFKGKLKTDRCSQRKEDSEQIPPQEYENQTGEFLSMKQKISSELTHLLIL